MDPTNVPKQFHHAMGGPPADVLPPPAFILEPPANGKVLESNGHDSKKVLNFSIQTGEEFSLEFMRDKVLTKKPLAPDNNGYSNGASTFVGIGQSSSSDSTKITVERVSSSKAFQVERANSGSKILNRSYLKMLKGLCSFNGKILPRPSDGKLRYVGGDTRIIQVPNGIQWGEFKQRMIQVYGEVNVVKYQLPGEGLDVLITVSNDDDLRNMMDEWNELDDGASKLRVFLFSKRDLDDLNTGFSSSDRDTESLYVSAINEVCSRRSSTVLTVESSSGNHSDALDLLSSIPVTSSPANVPPSENPSLFFLDPVDDVPIVENRHPVPRLNQKIEDAKFDLNSSVALLVDEFSSQRTYFSENFPKEQTLMVNRLSKSDESLSATPQRCEKAEVNPVADTCTDLIQSLGHSVDCGQFPTPISQSVSITNALEDPKLTHDVAFVADDTKKADILIDIGERFPPDFLSEILSNGRPQDEPIACLKLNNPETDRWPYSQKPAQDDFAQNNVSLIDQDHIPRVNSNVGLSPFVNHNYSSPDPQPDEKCDDPPSFHPILSKVDITALQIVKNKDLEELIELGSGTFGTVYHGKWRGTDVAIKRLKKICFSARSSEQERMALEFWHETEILSKLHHPNVVAFYGVVQDGPDDTLATVTEFMVDGSLRQVILRKDIVLDHRKKLIIAMDAAFGMEYLHSKNIVHFDLKCDNLLVNLKDPQRPICKVGDFGLSKIKRQTLVSGGVRGTLPWMAPELLNGSSTKVSEKVDVFSFGVVMWEILTGEEPYANMHYGAIIGGIVNNTLRPPIPMGCDPEWSNLMEQCWAPNPASRPSFTEVAYRLRLMSAAASNQPRSTTSN